MDQLNESSSSSEINLEEILPQVVISNFEILSRLDAGECEIGVYRVKEKATKVEYAMKVQEKEPKKPGLSYEAQMLPFLEDKLRVPHFYAYYQEEGIECLILELIEGIPLDRLQESSQIKLRDIARELIELIRNIHHTGYTHGNIKGGNFLKTKNHLYLIDFEVSRRWMNFETGEHLSKKELLVNKYQGNRLYRSSFVDYYEPITRRAELESMCFVLWRLWSENLPWEGIIEEREKVVQMKRAIEVQEIENIPNFLKKWLTLTRNLEYQEEPPYPEYLAILEEEFGEKVLIKN